MGISSDYNHEVKFPYEKHSDGDVSVSKSWEVLESVIIIMHLQAFWNVFEY